MVSINTSALQHSFEITHANDLAYIFRDSVRKVGAICGTSEVTRFFRLATVQSETSGFELRGEIVKYAFLALHLGASFRTDPLYQPVRQSMLWGHSGVHPNVGLNRMFRSTDLMIAEGLCAATDGVAPGFGAACKTTRQSRPHSAVHAAFEVCAKTNPKRIEARGADHVRSSLEQYSSHLTRQDLTRHDFVVDWLICTYHLGFSFDRNPLFAWVPEALAKDGLSHIGDILDG